MRFRTVGGCGGVSGRRPLFNGMRKTIIRIAILLSLLLALPLSALSAGKTLLTSPRSLRVIAAVSPSLKASLSEQSLEFGAPIYIRIFKEELELELWVQKGDRYQLFRRYPICTYGFAGLGPKLREGDGKAPEGFYFVRPSALNPLSSFHLSFNLGYPNRYDRTYGRTGSALMVHGDCVSIGCYAMGDDGIDEIYTLADAALRGGQKFFRVHIFPFRMTAENVKRHSGSKWDAFWGNLKEGYDLFRQNGYRPPNVQVRDGRYVFEPVG